MNKLLQKGKTSTKKGTPSPPTFHPKIKKALYNEGDFLRDLLQENSNDFRSDYFRDYARILHSPAFRRLQFKTQLFPNFESDYFRTRMSHSYEVAQIGKSIALKLNKENQYFKTNPISTELVEAASIAHDIGHPPFGHIGERALDKLMATHGGFEGNAQTLRILTKLEKKVIDYDELRNSPHEDCRKGLNLTFRTLASIIKYDSEIIVDTTRNKAYDGVTKGYYSTEKDIVKKIKENVVGSAKEKLVTIESQIMDLADDIAYSVFDFEDTLKSGFIHILDLLSCDESIKVEIEKKIKAKNSLPSSFGQKEIDNVLFNIVSPFISKDYFSEDELRDLDFNHTAALFFGTGRIYGHVSNMIRSNTFRTELTSGLVNEFINAVTVDINPKYPVLSVLKMNQEKRIKLEVLKYFIFYSITKSPRIQLAEFRGKEIINAIWEVLMNDRDGGINLLPTDHQQWLKQRLDVGAKNERPRIICDFIAGMTDRYAIEFYGRLKSEQPETIFKLH